MSRPGSTPAAARWRRGRVLRWVFLAILLVPMLEIAVIIAVGRSIGGWPTFGLLLLESLIGAVIVRREGGRAWSALREALRSGRMPSRQLADAALVLVGGTLLLTPGFVTDAVGFFVVLPATRPITRRWLEALVARRLLGSFGDWPGGRGPDGPPDVIQGEVVD
ncbi:FxsA family protein [uncultured Phycicoccus sp.]|uniref:FxsA family protein n=1 Tax=uncultured Phycicoccus sp. TaxID=661422 RepID=UPI00261212EA|nr:FxsA family protein [uncultured Phycicoccus sp.]